MKVITRQMTRGHIILILSDGRFLYISGEMVVDGTFYAWYGSDWYWIHEPKRQIILLKDDEIIAPLTNAEKDTMLPVIKEYSDSERYKIIVD